jgi:hypothetical protein
MGLLPRLRRKRPSPVRSRPGRRRGAGPAAARSSRPGRTRSSSTSAGCPAWWRRGRASRSDRRALSRGDAFITAPTGALGAAFAVAAGLIGGGPLTLPVVAGLLLALIGGGASAWTPPGARRAGGRPWQSAATCVAAAAAVAVMLIALHASGRADPYWATATEHLSTAASAVAAALAGSRGRLRGHLPAAGQLPKLAVVALGGAGGDVAYAVASGGALSIVSAVSSLYPLPTIALGVALQGQRPTRVQFAGITAALAGAVLLGAVS